MRVLVNTWVEVPLWPVRRAICLDGNGALITLCVSRQGSSEDAAWKTIRRCREVGDRIGDVGVVYGINFRVTRPAMLVEYPRRSRLQSLPFSTTIVRDQLDDRPRRAADVK